MILIGQYDSPFVRRVGIALRLYSLEFEQVPLSVFGDAAAISAINPLIRVPTLVLDDGLVLTDSHLILDCVDGMVAAPLVPRSGMDRATVLRITGLFCGVAEKAVSLFYEKHLHEIPSANFSARCALQIITALTTLEAERALQAGPWWFGEGISHADIALGCALRFLRDAHPDLLPVDRYPHLQAAAAQAESLPVFHEISQNFVPPA